MLSSLSSLSLPTSERPAISRLFARLILVSRNQVATRTRQSWLPFLDSGAGTSNLLVPAPSWLQWRGRARPADGYRENPWHPPAVLLVALRADVEHEVDVVGRLFFVCAIVAKRPAESTNFR